MKAITCPHENTEMVIESKTDRDHDILKCQDCGVTGHRVPTFVYVRGKS